MFAKNANINSESKDKYISIYNTDYSSQQLVNI